MTINESPMEANVVAEMDTSAVESASTETSVETPVAAPVETISFNDSLPEDLREDPSLKDFKDAGSLAKSYLHAKKTLGSAIRIPADDASDEARNEFYAKLATVPGVMKLPSTDDGYDEVYSKLGRPDSSDKYEFKIDEGLNPNPEVVGEFADMAYEIGLSQTQADSLVQWQSAKAEVAINSHNQSVDYTEQTLRGKWGNDYDTRMLGAKMAIQSYSETYPEAAQDLLSNSASTNPIIIDMASQLAGLLKEKGVIGSSTNLKYGMSSEDAMDKINQVKSDSHHAYFNDNDPSHSAAVKMMNDLYDTAYPEG